MLKFATVEPRFVSDNLRVTTGGIQAKYAWFFV